MKTMVMELSSPPPRLTPSIHRAMPLALLTVPMASGFGTRLVPCDVIHVLPHAWHGEIQIKHDTTTSFQVKHDGWIYNLIRSLF